MTLVAVITGASSGIGIELVRSLHRRGYHLGLLARREAELAKLADEIESDGGKVFYKSCDVCNFEQVQAAMQDTIEALGSIDIVIANAGIGDAMPLHRYDQEIAKRIVDVNLMGVMNTVSAVLPHFIEKRSGQIVGMSSLAAFITPPKSYVYCASKAAVNTYLQGLAMEARNYSIDVTVVMPGFVKTPLTDKNNFAMPFLMGPERAAELIVKAIERKSTFFYFPKIMYWGIRLISLLPKGLQRRVLG